MYASRVVGSRCIGRLRQASLLASRLAVGFSSSYSTSETHNLGSHSSAPGAQDGHPHPVLSHSQSPSLPGSKPAGSELEALEDPALDIFNQIVNTRQADSSPDQPQNLITELELTTKLKILSERASQKNGAEAVASFQAFKSEIFPHLAPLRLKGKLPKHMYQALTRYLAKVSLELYRKHWDGKTALDVLRVQNWFNIWDVQTRLTFLLGACVEVIKSKTTERRKEDKVMELIDLWKQISQENRFSQVAQPLRFVFPTRQEIAHDIDLTESRGSASGKHPLQRWLASLFPQHEISAIPSLMPCLVATGGSPGRQAYID